MVDCDWITQWEGVPKVGALGDIVNPGGNQQSYRVVSGHRTRLCFSTKAGEVPQGICRTALGKTAGNVRPLFVGRMFTAVNPDQ